MATDGYVRELQRRSTSHTCGDKAVAAILARIDCPWCDLRAQGCYCTEPCGSEACNVGVYRRPTVTTAARKPRGESIGEH